MPQANTITVNDSTATGVAFTPVSVGPTLSQFANRHAVVSLGDQALRVGFSSASNKRPTHRITISLALPNVVSKTLDTGEQYEVTHTARAEVTFIVPVGATSVNRADLLALTANALDHADIVSTVEDLEPVY